MTTSSSLLGIFFQDVTNEFLRQSTDLFDWVLFAIGPLGVGSVLLAAIRVLGSRFLKYRIGKAGEDEDLIEKDLMSSTSPNVWELWNGYEVVRVTGQADIQEFLLLGDAIWKPSDAKREHFEADRMY